MTYDDGGWKKRRPRASIKVADLDLYINARTSGHRWRQCYGCEYGGRGYYGEWRWVVTMSESEWAGDERWNSGGMMEVGNIRRRAYQQKHITLPQHTQTVSRGGHAATDVKLVDRTPLNKRLLTNIEDEQEVDYISLISNKAPTTVKAEYLGHQPPSLLLKGTTAWRKYGGPDWSWTAVGRPENDWTFMSLVLESSVKVRDRIEIWQRRRRRQICCIPDTSRTVPNITGFECARRRSRMTMKVWSLSCDVALPRPKARNGENSRVTMPEIHSGPLRAPRPLREFKLEEVLLDTGLEGTTRISEGSSKIRINGCYEPYYVRHRCMIDRFSIHSRVEMLTIQVEMDTKGKVDHLRHISICSVGYAVSFPPYFKGAECVDADYTSCLDVHNFFVFGPYSDATELYVLSPPVIGIGPIRNLEDSRVPSENCPVFVVSMIVFHLVSALRYTWI
ncbi:hypothetical protein EDD18DRAFT_1116179 [Armillaria luteobubalina]|uniref:Uncharacterized protein n=1 Tax=Armillaria luteobubalina TaxID=153913 RepID=A0AA39P018_9AGAR|nr:hypothetical protein EDD18DRAFT_1116179 [Armillaria luteobubalina]